MILLNRRVLGTLPFFSALRNICKTNTKVNSCPKGGRGLFFPELATQGVTTFVTF